jgi:outer membrane protein assembly factor BamB
MATKVEPCLKWQTPGQQPNGLQATTEGLWVIDQIDPNVIYLLDYADGRELRRIPTRALHSSAITIDPSGNIWVASTFTYELICFDRATGKELVAYRTPPFDTSGGPHGTEWRDGQLWFDVLHRPPMARSCTRFHSAAIAPTASPGTRMTPLSGVSTAIAA